jgi:hypothetical protein
MNSIYVGFLRWLLGIDNKTTEGTDNKLSLGTLDPTGGQGILGQLWELFIVSIVIMFAVSIIHQVAREKHTEMMKKKQKRD